MATTSPLGNLRRRFRTALDRSRLRTVLAAAADTSRALAVPAILSRATAHARVTRGLRTVKRWGSHSVLYRWLTKEPDPDVVVIDLRETYTVGPFIAVLDRMAVPLGRSYHASGLQSLADGAAGVASALAATRVGRALGRALAPPEPPDAPSTGERPGEGPSETGSDSGSGEPPDETADTPRTDPD